MKGQSTIKLLASAFQGRPPVVFFDYEPKCGARPRPDDRVLGMEALEALGLAGDLPSMFFSHEISRDVHEYNATVNTLQYNGISRTTTDTGKWALLWSWFPSPETLRSLHPLQKTNHFPASWQLGRKDLLSKNVSRMRRQWPKDYNIAPTGFVMPEDFQAWVTAREQAPEALWIWKPINSSCGRGIHLLSSAVPANTDRKLAQKTGIVQRYLDRPLLIDGFKFDLRLYVVVTSFDPLKVYLNEEGLVRLATERYSCSRDTLNHRTMHLTNYSVNKHAKGYAKNLDGLSPERSTRQGAADAPVVCGEEGEEEEAKEVAVGGEPSSKWSLKQLREHFMVAGLDYAGLMKRIKDLVIKTLIAAEPSIASAWHQGANYSSLGVPSSLLGPHQTCFEIYGFDVMVDDKLKPWLVEVNVYPSLSSSSPFDKRVKTTLIADALQLAGFLPFDCDLVEKAGKAESAKRSQGLGAKPGNTSRSHTLQSIPTAALKDLGESEWRLILDTHDEYLRRGFLERIYPRQDTLGQYDRFFSAVRYSNLVLARWLEAGGEKCFLPESKEKLPPHLPQQVHFHSC